VRFVGGVVLRGLYVSLIGKLGSERYVEAKLEPMTSQQSRGIRKTFRKYAHPLFKKAFAASRHQPYGKTADYVMALGKLILRKLQS
jgi:hypothetical protein